MSRTHGPPCPSSRCLSEAGAYGLTTIGPPDCPDSPGAGACLLTGISRHRSLALLCALGLSVFARAGDAQSGNITCDLSRLAPCVELFGESATIQTQAGGLRSLLTGDFNRDAHRDLVMPDNTSDHLLVYLGRGNGTFDGPYAVGTPLQPLAITSDDFNSDGLVDLAVVTGYSNTVSVLYGDGTGGFPTRLDLTNFYDPSSIAAGDLDQDGHEDLVVTDTTDPATIYVLFGPLDAPQVAQIKFAIPGFPNTLAVCDINGNGHPDIVVLSESSGSTELLAILDPTRAGPSNESTLWLPAGDYFRGMTIADLNADGRPDLAMANVFRNSCVVLLANGEGGFDPPRSFATSRDPVSVEVADVNRDGVPDLLLPCFDGSSVSCLLGIGDGEFVHQGDYCTELDPMDLVAADFNEDGWADFATANVLLRSVSVVLNAGRTIGTPAVVTGAVVSPIGRPGEDAGGLLRLRFPGGVTGASVNVGSIRIAGKQVPSLAMIGPSFPRLPRTSEILFRFDAADLGPEPIERGLIEVSGCFNDGKLFTGRVQLRARASDLGAGTALVWHRGAPTSPRSPVEFVVAGDIQAKWTLSIVDVHGRLIWSKSEVVSPGGRITWDKTSRAGTRVPSGIYFFRLESDVGTAVGKLPILR